MNRPRSPRVRALEFMRMHTFGRESGHCGYRRFADWLAGAVSEGFPLGGHQPLSQCLNHKIRELPAQKSALTIHSGINPACNDV